MVKKLLLISALAVAGYFGYDTYKMYKGGYFSMPELGPNDFSLSFKSGFRGVMRDIPDHRPARRYLASQASGVPEWFQETWSECRRPLEKEQTAFEQQLDVGPGGRLEAICEIDAGGDIFVRGWFISVPNL
ncbi:hypothetical protein DSM110093_01966 [Sulfitobacter sp. DSM 110093]|uniref:hypothetical protein n=1 Tax=Sulfitobacter sp. DSM 110093 TaxID=2883127 RepID=UPI001FACE7C2|nr:hypothetical protein [Sulfitobacter sp. DSM 110093]UOA32182.1 hypothetical protein DSM110093_01966 [Sulfitobacter sp. DSM 110093]